MSLSQKRIWFIFLIRKKSYLTFIIFISHLMSSFSSPILPNLSQGNRCLISSFFPSSTHFLIFDSQTCSTQPLRVWLLRPQESLLHVQRSSNHFHFHIMMDHQSWLCNKSIILPATFTNWSKLDDYSNSSIYDYIWICFFQEGKPKILVQTLLFTLFFYTQLVINLIQY